VFFWAASFTDEGPRGSCAGAGVPHERAAPPGCPHPSRSAVGARGFARRGAPRRHAVPPSSLADRAAGGSSLQAAA